MKKEKFVVPSPCLSICTMDEQTGYCRGCFRTLQEITEWERSSDERKCEILNMLASRRPPYDPARRD